MPRFVPTLTFCTIGLALSVFTETARAEATPGEPREFAAAANAGDFFSTVGLHLTLGLAYGGEEFATLSYTDGSEASVRGGEGLILSGGFTLTPFWIGDRVGIGLGVDAGWKYKSTSVAADASVKLQRFPVVTSIRTLVNVGKAWHVLVAGGLAVDVNPNLYGDGLLEELDITMNDGIGGMAELGVLWGRPDSIGYEITGRYTGMSYTHDDSVENFDASSGSIHLTAHYFF